MTIAMQETSEEVTTAEVHALCCVVFYAALTT
jgi:hypothetical protein